MTENKLGSTSTTRQRSAPYPRYTLQQVEKFAEIVFSEGPRNCDQDTVAKKAGYSSSQNGSFFAMRSAAGQFGLVVAKGDRISVSEEWITAFHEDSAENLRRSRQWSMKQPHLYSLLLEAYSDVQLPPVDKLARTVYIDSKYGITKEAAKEAIKTFVESAQYAGILDEKNRLHVVDVLNTSVSDKDFGEEDKQAQKLTDVYSGHGDPRIPTPMITQRSTPQTSTLHSAGDTNIVTVPASMEKQEFTFRGGKKAYFISPAPLPRGEKERLKQWLDLLKLHIELTLEDEQEPPSQNMIESSN